jgi:ribose 5-phosphate isomerase B
MNPVVSNLKKAYANSSISMRIALATDHAGFEQLKALQLYLESLGHECWNFGPQEFVPEDDYPDYIKPAAEKVTNGECEFGIILGGSGQGEAMVANRFANVRCAVFYGPVVPLRIVDAEGHESRDPYEIVRLSREHNNANMLSLAARFVSLEDMKHILKIWLETPFSGEERHQRRINKIDRN